MRRSHRLPVLYLATLALLGSWPALAKEATPPEAAAIKEPAVIATADVSMRADADERFAQDVIERSKGRDRTAGLEKSLVHLAETVELESQRFKRDELSVLSITRLESLERHWGFFARELSDWRRELKQVTSQYTEDAAELARRRALWEATRAAAGTSAMAPALSDRIGSVLAEIDAADVAVSGPIGRQISLSQRANVLETGILAGQKAVAAAISYNDHRLAKIDSPPLWQAANDPQQHGDGLKSLETGLKVETTFLNEYREATQGYRNVRTVVALLMLPLLIWLGIRSRKVVSDDPEIQAAARVLRRPISSWLVLLMVSVVVFEPERADDDAPGGDVHRPDPGPAIAAAGRVLGTRSVALRRHRPVPAPSAVVPVPCESLLLPRCFWSDWRCCRSCCWRGCCGTAGRASMPHWSSPRKSGCVSPAGGLLRHCSSPSWRTCSATSRSPRC